MTVGNLANRLTLLRIILIPVFMAFLLSRLPLGDWLAAGVFVIAALTDSVDGYIARKHNQITVFGQFFDPLADKLLILAALITLVGQGRLSAWLAMIIITREFAVSGLRYYAWMNGRVIAASPLGKVKTVSQVIAIIFWILKPAIIPTLLADVVMGIAVAITIVSGLDYYLKIGPSLDQEGAGRAKAPKSETRSKGR